MTCLCGHAIDCHAQGGTCIATAGCGCREYRPQIPPARAALRQRPLEATRREQVLTEASALIVGDRQADYGPPSVNFGRIATIWRVMFPERDWTPADVALAMFGVKIGRAVQGYKRDTAVDMAGYAALWAELAETA